MGNGNLSRDSKDSGVSTLIWGDSSLKLIDQRKLPFEEVYVDCTSVEMVAEAIREMVVRGAPAIGVAAGYGVAIAALNFKEESKSQFTDSIKASILMLSGTRPTAVNLFWALNRMENVLDNNKDGPVGEIAGKLVKEARKIEEEDLDINYRIGANGIRIFKGKPGRIKVLTHCNAGALATSGYGTALAVVRSLSGEGKIEEVVVDETRPFLQGARLTAWELYQEKIPFYIISDNMAGYFMSKGGVDAVIVGSDRIAANGDAANKIGTLGVSILAKYYSIPFYVAAPLSTIDINTETGDRIPIEQRNPREMREVLGKVIIPGYMPVKNPSFDVTPAKNITAIITEEEVIYPPFKENIERIFSSIKTNSFTGGERK